jgi:hypothetical protein
METARTSQVPGGSLCVYALLSDPGRTNDVRPYNAISAAPAASTAKAPELSGLNDTALTLAVYASWVGLPQHCTQDSLPAVGHSTGRDWLPAGSH